MMPKKSATNSITKIKNKIKSKNYIFLLQIDMTFRAICTISHTKRGFYRISVMLTTLSVNTVSLV